MSISPISSPIYSAPLNNLEKPQAKEAQAKTKVENKKEETPELIVNIKYQPEIKAARITSSLKDCYDTNMWYTLREDGSGEVMGAWGRGIEFPKGTFDKSYNAIKEAYKDGKTPDKETTEEIYKMCKEAEEKAMETYKAHPVNIYI